MQADESVFHNLANYLYQTLSADPNVRRPAEKILESIESQPNYPILLLKLIDNVELEMTVRVAGAVTFKNLIKRNWPIVDDVDKIREEDRVAVKTLIVPLMLRSPSLLQKQLSDAISIIGKYDFPKKWPQLIDDMVEKFATGDFNVINGVLQTAHSIFKRYRYEFKSQSLWEEIKHVLDRMAKPLTDLLHATMQLAKEHQNNVDSLKVIYGSLVLMCKVFYSLNCQDLPEYFEDNMATWMSAFHQLLTVDEKCLQSDDDNEPGLLEHLRSQICENIRMYAHKYDEEFAPYMETFVTAVWELLVKIGNQTKYDSLVSNALQFLSIVADRHQYRYIFENPDVLASICEKVVIPNLDFRQSDEELFEDSPEEYIRRDIEGSDIDTRRRSACDLVKTLSQNFEQKVFALFGQYLEVLLAKYKENPMANWRAKDSAIYLVTSLASRGSTEKRGITQVSELVPLPQFCEQHIITELERADVNAVPVLKAAALKFIMVFRSILGQQTILFCFPQLIRHLQAGSVVVHSYAACAIEKILITRNSNNVLICDVNNMSAFVNHLIPGLFATLELPGSNENEYVMKAIMRSYALLQEATMPYMALALPRLTETLAIVAKNPSKPHFNHYLFETLSLAVKIVCKVDASAVCSFEEALFPVFQNILQQDVIEFMPYVFQMLSLLLEVRENMQTIPDPYWALFPCLLVPALWDRPGNITPLIRLVSAYIKQGSKQIQAMEKLNAILGIFQKMIASKANDQEGFYLLQNLICHYPTQELQQSMRQIFALLFQRLSLAKTTKYVKGIIVFFCFYTVKFSANELADLIDQIQAFMFAMVVERIIIPDMAKVGSTLDRKIVAVGVTKMLTECPKMLTAPYAQHWLKLLEALIELFELPPDQNPLEGDTFIEIDDTPGYQVAFSQLSFAKPKEEDFLKEIVDARKYLAEQLFKLFQTRSSEIQSLMATMNANYKPVLQKYCTDAGVTIYL